MGPLTLLFEHVAVVAGVLLAAVSVVLVLTQRRSPQSAVAWLVSIVLVPYVAVPVFLVLGFRKQARYLPSIQFAPVAGEVASHSLAEIFGCLGAPDASTGNSFELHDAPEAAFASLEALVDDAEVRLDVLFYIVEPDEFGHRFIEKLARKAAEGVQVRLLLDGFGTLTRPRRALTALEAAGGAVRYSSPVFQAPFRSHLNLRNHRKMVVADAQQVWTGGRNIGTRYFASDGWVDLSCALKGPAVQGFLDVFENDWANIAGQIPATAKAAASAPGDAVLQLVAAGPDEPWDTLHSGLVQAIHAARDRVWVATPYFVPTEVLAHALVTAARRGIDVRLLVPRRSNKRVTDLARGAYLRELARNGATVLLAPGRMMHAKMGVIDDVAWLGTANFDVRSMLLNFETVLFAYDAATVGTLSGWFEALAAAANPGTADVHPPQRVLEGLFRLGSPIL